MHRAADRLHTSVLPRIKSVVMFGNPYERLGGLSSQFPYALRSKVLQLCADGDPVSLASIIGRVLPVNAGSTSSTDSRHRSATLEHVSSIT